MYTNIPIQTIIDITNKLLQDSTNRLDIKQILEIINLIKTTTEQNYFEHNGQYYIQKEGLPMGNPLSGALTEIYLNNFENTHIINSKNPYINNITYWYRYVDDILILFKGSDRQLNNLHNYINKINKHITFTLEKETNKTINFLDLTIQNIQNKHSFKIYRKPTHTDHTIHKTSNHPIQHKLAAFHHMIYRLNKIPMNYHDYNEELKTIKYIATRNGYNPNMIDKMNDKNHHNNSRRNYTTLNSRDDNQNDKYISIDYNQKTNKHIKKTLQEYGYKTAFSTKNKLENKLRERNNTNINTGIYKITCNDCPAFYIGQTGRDFKIRYNEHIKAIDKPNIKSNFAEHIQKTKHTHTDIETNLKIIARYKKGPLLDRMEEYNIYKNRKNPNLLNDKINSRTNKIYDKIIENNRIRYTH